MTGVVDIALVVDERIRGRENRVGWKQVIEEEEVQPLVTSLAETLADYGKRPSSARVTVKRQTGQVIQMLQAGTVTVAEFELLRRQAKTRSVPTTGRELHTHEVQPPQTGSRTLRRRR